MRKVIYHLKAENGLTICYSNYENFFPKGSNRLSDEEHSVNCKKCLNPPMFFSIIIHEPKGREYNGFFCTGCRTEIYANDKILHRNGCFSNVATRQKKMSDSEIKRKQFWDGGTMNKDEYVYNKRSK